MSFDTLGLRAELLRAISDSGYTIPTPVQAQAIPVILAGRDILAEVPRYITYFPGEASNPCMS